MAKDGMVSRGLMLSRIGFSLAFVLGMVFLFDLFEAGSLVMLHMLAGVITLAGIWLAAVRMAVLKRPRVGPLYAAAGLALIGGAMGLGVIGQPGVAHMVVMVAAVGLAEMGAARGNRAG